MKKLFTISIVLFANSVTYSQKISERTGIYLDTLKNEVILGYVNNEPAFYYSNIFTPVCETGECKPIYINIYWDLMGNYLRFDQPKGEILTKADHVPFTEDDYDLLDEILRGDDPRYGSLVKHSDTYDGAEPDKMDSQASPAPAVESRMIMKKEEMVDAVSGATLEPHVTKFVPGALYTTYTCWDLANTHRNMMMDYTRSKLFIPEYRPYFFGQKDYQLRYTLIQHIASKSPDRLSLTKTLVSVIDTSQEVAFRDYCIDQIYFMELGSEPVTELFTKLFFERKDVDLQRKILNKWNSINMPVTVLQKLVKSFDTHPELFDDIVYTFDWQEFWPEGIVLDLCKEIQKQESQERRQAIFDLFEKRRAETDKVDWKQVQKVKKKYKLKSRSS